MISEKELNELATLEKRATEISSLCQDTRHKTSIDKLQAEKSSFMPRLFVLREKQALARKQREDSELLENLKHAVQQRDIRISNRGNPIKINDNLEITVSLNCGHSRKIHLTQLLSHAEWELVLRHGAILEPSLNCDNQCREEIKSLESKWRKSDSERERLARLKRPIYPTTIQVVRV